MDFFTRLKQCEHDYLDTNITLLGFSPWIEVKLALSRTYIGNDGKSNIQFQPAGTTAVKMLIIHLLSLNWFRFLARTLRAKQLYFGATSGLYQAPNQQTYVDLYFPREAALEKTVLLFHNAASHRLKLAQSYVRPHSLLLYNPIVSVMERALKPIVNLLHKRRFNNLTEQSLAVLNKHQLSLEPSLLRTLLIKFYVRTLISTVLLLPFRMIGIRKAYIVSAYTKSDIVAALKRLGFVTIEVQHGFLNSAHPGYNYPKEINNPHKLPAPDRLLVTSQDIRDDLHEKTLYTLDRTAVKENLKWELATPATLPFSGKRMLLFTGQSLYIDDIHDFFAAALTAFDETYVMVYRPHPRETPDIYRRITELADGKRLVIINDTKLLTESLLKQAAAHISVYSSCHFDAVDFLGKTFILNCQKNNPLAHYASSDPKRFITVSSIKEVIERL